VTAEAVLLAPLGELLADFSIIMLVLDQDAGFLYFLLV